MFLNEIKNLNSDFKKIIFKYLNKYIILVLLYTFISFTSVYPTRLIGYIIDSISKVDFSKSEAFNSILIYILIRALNLIFNFWATYYKEKTGTTLIIKLREKSVEKLLNFKYIDSSDNLQSSQYVTRIFDAIDKINESLFNIVLWIGKSLPTFIFTFYFLFKINYIVALLIIPFIIIMAIFTNKISKVQRRFSEYELNSKSKIIDFINEIALSFETIKIFNCKNYMINKYSKIENEWCKNKIKSNIVLSFSFLSLSLFGIVITSIILISSINFKTIVNPGDIAVLILYTGNIFIVIMDVFNNVLIFSVLGGALKRFNELFRGKEFDEIKDNKKDLEFTNYDIKLENINFKYKDKLVLSDISLKVPYGNKVAIVGKNGIGKSTLLKVISGVYKPSSGNIYICNNNTNIINDKQLDEIFSYALQYPYIYNDTLSSNVLLGNNYEEDILKKAYSVCNMSELGDVYNLIINNNGKNLSGGQKQKISICRALIKNSKILILDEYNNSLDLQSQNNILNHIIELDNTVLVVTHNKEIIEKFDLIIFFDNKGNCIFGNHYNLLLENSEYNSYFN